MLKEDKEFLISTIAKALVFLAALIRVIWLFCVRDIEDFYIVREPGFSWIDSFAFCAFILGALIILTQYPRSILEILEAWDMLKEMVRRDSVRSLLRKRDRLVQKIKTITSANRPMPYRVIPVLDSTIAKRIEMNAVPESAREELMQLEEVESSIAIRRAAN